MHQRHIQHRGGFPWGWTPITGAGTGRSDTGMDFGVLRLRAGEEHPGDDTLEEAFLLMDGAAIFRFDGRQVGAERRSLFDEDPHALHHGPGATISVRAETDVELVICRTTCPRVFPTVLYDPDSILESEHRDKGRLDDTSHRIVRTIFDGRNRPEANLVLGEVITFPGRWSSYPPHHHPQPEIYHYRFTDPRGYGHAELGEDVLKVRPFDTLEILDLHDHSQVAAPGYGMFYVWAIRHLPGQPYTAPEFTAAHTWLQAEAPAVWHPAPEEDA
ncbi:MAG: 5-deoxy-glucuronate isomerase [Pseudomonadota bacterium]